MKLGRLVAACVVALGLCHAGAQASTASSSASIYDITFQVSDGGLTFGAPGGEATALGYELVDSDGNLYIPNPLTTTSEYLFAPISISSGVVTDPTSGATASVGASSGSTSSGYFLTSSGGTNMPLGRYSSSVGQNQTYEGSSTFGGWFTLDPGDTLTLSGRYSLMSSLAGTLCTTDFLTCSRAAAGVHAALEGAILVDELLSLGVDTGLGSETRQGTFEMIFTNDGSYNRNDFFFSFSVFAEGLAAVLDNGNGGNDGGPGGPGGPGGNVPEPSTTALIALALGGLVWSRRQRREPAQSLPALAA